MSTHHATHGAIGHGRASDQDTAMAHLLELDAEVLAPYLAELTGWLADLARHEPVRILDLGSGPGTGSLALAHRFGSATVTAVDVSPQMLHRLRKAASAQGVGHRISTLEADLDEPWTQVGLRGPCDLIWAAAFLHHVADPASTFARAFENLRPGGLLAVTEMDFFPRVLPDDTGVGRPGLEARLHAATNTQPSSEWTEALQHVGFIVEERRSFEIRIDRAPAGKALNDYAQACVSRLRSHAAEVLDPDDLAAWDQLLDQSQPHSIAGRDDLCVQTTRTTWVARRP